MPINEATGLAQDMGVTEEMMACPLPRVPLIDPETFRNTWPRNSPPSMSAA